MTVWIVNPFDSLPAEGNRPLRYWLMAEAFAAAGHEVVYWTADFNHVTKRPRTCLGTVPKAGAGKLQVIAVHEPKYGKNVSIRRMWAHWRWAVNWYRSAKSFTGESPRRPDLIIASSPPLYIGRMVRRLAGETGAKTIFDIMDAWPETFERVVPKCLTWPLRLLAKANYLGADAITTVSDQYVDLARKYGYSGEIRRFYHGIELGTVPKEDGGRSGTVPNAVKVVYAGNMGRSYDLVTAAEAVALVDGVTLEVAGKGDGEAKLKAATESLGLGGRIVFRGYLDAGALDGFLSGGDIGLVPMAPESCVGIPYKFADYAKAGLAIASSLGGESDRLLAKYGAGAAYRPGDAQSLAETLKRIVRQLGEMREGSRRMARMEFDASSIYGEYRKFAESVAAG